VAETERGIHPDLLEETTQAAEQAAEKAAAQAEQPQTSARARRGGRAARPAAVPSAADPSPEAEADRASQQAASANGASPPSQTGGEANGGPEWLKAARESSDPQEMLATLLKNVPIEELSKHPQISGWIGNMAQRRAREQSLQQQTEEAQRAKLEAWQRGDYYRLGELTAPEQEAQILQRQQQEAAGPFMQSVEAFQKKLDPEVQQQIQGKQYSSFEDYLDATVQAAVSHRLPRDVEAEIKKRQPALHKAELSATVGAEPSPERESGPSPGVREITDAEIERMSLAEYERLFDDNGHPRNGVRLRLTRGIDVTRR
jgi:hypothetical protein